MFKAGDKIVVKEGMHALAPGQVAEIVDTRVETKYEVRGLTDNGNEIVQVLFEREVEQPHGLVMAARMLKSEDGENPEYDRALVELIAAFIPYSRGEVAAMVGVGGQEFD